MTDRQARLWDLPVRLTHGVFILGVAAAWLTYEFDAMEWHVRNGYLMLTLVLFRLLWGLFGSRSARFASFLTGPGPVLAYLRGNGARRWPGHSPVGGWAVAVLLLALLIQGATGLFARDDLFIEGPLAHLVSEATSDQLTGFHETFFFYGVLVLIGIHVAAVLFYRFVRRQDLITPMINGRAPLAPADAAALDFAPLWRAGLLLAISAGAIWFVATQV